MKLTIHTKYGTFKCTKNDDYDAVSESLSKLSKLSSLNITTDEGEIFMGKDLIADSLFVLEKEND